MARKMERHNYEIAKIVCPHCKNDDMREVNGRRYWCPDCNSFWHITMIAVPLTKKEVVGGK
jgi:transposase-like protein